MGKIINFPQQPVVAVPLNTHVAADTMEVLQEIADKECGGSINEAVRRSVAGYEFILVELDRGSTIVVYEKRTAWWRLPRGRTLYIQRGSTPL